MNIERNNLSYRLPATDYRLPSTVYCLLAAVYCLLLIPSALAQSAGGSFTVAPPPAWVLNELLPPDADKQTSQASQGVAYLLSDEQTRVTGTTERFYREARRIVSTPGIEHASQLELEFEPTHQRLVIHYINLVRGKQTINALRPREIRLIAQEEEKEQRLFNGTLAALAILKDVRVGDIIDYAWSVVGENPILGGRFADSTYLVQTVPTLKLRYRLLWPAARKLNYRLTRLDLQPAVRNPGGEVEYLWERADVPAAPATDAAAPAWYDELPLLQLSEFADWGGVVNWALPLYQTKPTLSPALARQVAAWRAQFSQPEQQLLAALRFVQDEVRYLGIEMGPHSHQPHEPAEVLAQRYGDCKDKTYLLTTLLNALGIEAHAALINTTAQHTLAELLPSPYSFDHVIARAQLNGKTYWFDPTISLQRGGLAQHYNPDYERALVVRPGGAALEEIPPPESPSPTREISEVYTVAADGAAQLEVTSTYRGIDADAMRDELAQQSLSEFTKHSLDYYRERDKEITAAGEPRVSDDEAANVIVVTESYRLPHFWRDGTRMLRADEITKEWHHSSAREDKPLRLTYPLNVNQAIEIHLPTAIALKTDAGEVEHAALSFSYARTRNDRTIRLDCRLRTRRGYVKADEAAAYRAAVGRIEDASYLVLRAGGTWATGASWAVVAMALAIFGPFVVIGVRRKLRARRARPRLTEFKQTTSNGSAPATAIDVADEAELERSLTAIQCGCGASYDPTNAGRQTMIYDGQRLVAARLLCARCGHSRDLYFVCPRGGG